MMNNCWASTTCQKYIRTNHECLNNDCIKLFKLNYLCDQALLSEKQRQHVPLLTDHNSIYDDTEKFIILSNIEKNIKQFVDTGGSLYIHSIICGNGKTSWALRLLQSYLIAIWPGATLDCHALFINVPRFLLALKDSISNKNDYVDHIKANILKADLVVWDEIATKEITVYEHENMLSLLNARLDEGKANIYTSNLQDYELENKIGSRLYSRIVGLSENIELHGLDKRALGRTVIR